MSSGEVCQGAQRRCPALLTSTCLAKEGFLTTRS